LLLRRVAAATRRVEAGLVSGRSPANANALDAFVDRTGYAESGHLSDFGRGPKPPVVLAQRLLFDVERSQQMLLAGLFHRRLRLEFRDFRAQAIELRNIKCQE
jgi:hypothetical protein